VRLVLQKMSLVFQSSCRASLPRLCPRYTTSSIRLNTTTATPSPIPVAEAPAFEEFKESILPSSAPCLLRSCIAHWPALARWTDFSNLKGSEAGAKAVPIEVARIPAGEAVAPGYNSKGVAGSSWDRVEMPLDVFLEALVRETDGGNAQGERWAAYLAQYALLDEVCAPLNTNETGR
jgi:hypothetical protein